MWLAALVNSVSLPTPQRRAQTQQQKRDLLNSQVVIHRNPQGLEHTERLKTQPVAQALGKQLLFINNR